MLHVTGSGFGGRVGTLEGGLKIFDEIWEGSERGSVQGVLDIDSGPAFGSSSSHEGEYISDLFIIHRIDIFVDQEISSD